MSEEVTWEEVLDAIGQEVWKLTPEEYRRCAHRDIVFGVTWQDIMAAVEDGIDAATLDPAQRGSQ